MQVDTGTGSWTYITDLSIFVAEHPAAYTNPPDFEADGQLYSLIAFNGDLFSIEANHGQLIRPTPQGADTVIADISFHFGHIVTIGLAQANGNLYVTNLGQYSITPDWEKLITFSRGLLFVDPTPGIGPNPGDLVSFQGAAVRAGLSGALSLKFGPDGLLYILEISTAAAGLKPETGKVTRLNPDGTFADVITGPPMPTGMTFGPDKALYISNFGAAPTGEGQVLRVPFPL